MPKPPTKWYVASLLLFWGSTVAFTFVDFASDKWFGIPWPTGPDLFPNNALAIPLGLAQLASGGLLIVAAWKGSAASATKRGAAFWIAAASVTGLASLVAYLFFGLWYVIYVMERDSL